MSHDRVNKHQNVGTENVTFVIDPPLRSRRFDRGVSQRRHPHLRPSRLVKIISRSRPTAASVTFRAGAQTSTSARRSL